MRDICITVPSNQEGLGISYNYFVYEVELKKLKQPFINTQHYFYLIAYGSGSLKAEGKSYKLTPGTLVHVSPFVMHEFIEERNLTYLYISFYGENVPSVLEKIGALENVTLYYGHEHLLEYWMNSIRRIRESNSSFITNAVFMHTVSYLTDGVSKSEESDFSAIESFIRENISNPELCLKMVAGIFFYSEKYFSHLFKEKFGIRFTEYLHDQRMRLALKLIGEGMRSVSEISAECGFSTSYYFSKVFKSFTGKSPANYIRERNAEKKTKN